MFGAIAAARETEILEDCLLDVALLVRADVAKYVVHLLEGLVARLRQEEPREEEGENSKCREEEVSTTCERRRVRWMSRSWHRFTRQRTVGDVLEHDRRNQADNEVAHPGAVETQEPDLMRQSHGRQPPSFTNLQATRTCSS